MFRVAVLASTFATFRGYGSPASFVDGLTPATRVAAAILALGAVAALFVGSGRDRALTAA